MHYKSKAIFKQKGLNVDKENGIIRNVVIVKEGIDKDDGFFTPEFLAELVAQAEEQKQGVKSRFGHPNMCKTTLGSFIGRYKNFRIEENKVLADLHLDPITQKTQVEGQGISMWDYLLEMSETNPDMFGNSINYSAKSKWEDKEIDGETKSVEVYTLKSFVASDLVDSPAATDELFKDSEDFGVMGTQFLDENPEIFKAVEENPEIIEDFINRYKTYLNVKNMSILKKVKKAVGITKDIDLTLADGNIVTVQTDAENPAVGDRVVDNEGSALADGDHLLPDGGKIVVEAGAITDIVEAEEGVGEKDVEELNKSHQSLLKEHNALKQNYQKQEAKYNELEEAMEMLADNFTTLAKSVKSGFKVPAWDEKNKLGKKGEKDDTYAKYKTKEKGD